MATSPLNRRPIAVDYFDPDAEQGQAGQLSFLRDCAHVKLADGSDVQLPYKGAQIGHSHGHPHPILVMLTGERSFVRLYLREADYAQRLPPDMPRQLRHGLEAAARRARWRKASIPALVLALVLMAVGGWFGVIWAFERVVAAVPASWEVEFGQAAVKSVSQGPPCDDPVVTAAVSEITNRLVKSLPKSQPYPFHVQVIWNPVENAFALPGGQIVVHSGLIASAASPDEVAGVLGHEIQHVLGRHTFRRIANELGISLVLAVVVGDNGVLARVASGGAELMGLTFDRGQEAESDRIGVRLAYDAGYDPAGLGAFFRRQMAKKDLSETSARLMAYLSTHPADGDRLNEIEMLAKNLPAMPPPTEDDLARWAMVRDHARTIPAKAPQ